MKRILFISSIIALAFAGCEKDPCKDVSCLNDGICVDGSCLCPEGFSGEYCQTSEPCNGVNCLNGGTCVDGSCICPPGFTGANCETPIQNDPCEGITCLNGGNCVNGLCNCPDGYTGADCSQQQTPSKITITRVDILRFPLVNSSGSSWDFTSLPDIYISCLFNGNSIYTSSIKYNDAASPGNYEFNTGGQLEIFNVTQQYSIVLYDDDNPSADDLMGGISFAPYWSNTNGFPNNVTMDTDDFEMKVYFSYEW